jgi:hypothetical protein
MVIRETSARSALAGVLTYIQYTLATLAGKNIHPRHNRNNHQLQLSRGHLGAYAQCAWAGCALSRLNLTMVKGRQISTGSQPEISTVKYIKS